MQQVSILIGKGPIIDGRVLPTKDLKKPKAVLHNFGYDHTKTPVKKSAETTTTYRLC